MDIATLLRAEIAARGPLPFSRFMEVALYDPTAGYYRRDHFGKEGDFYTAEQLQPTFGLLLRRFCEQHGITTIVQPGAGRAALRESFAGMEYIPLDVAYGRWPESFRGMILAHEFFDAFGTLMFCDIGHYESEISTLELFYEVIQDKFPNFAVHFCETSTNPIHYHK